MMTAVDEVLKWVKDELQLFGSARQILIDKLNQAKEIETKQRQEDKLNGMKEANELLDELIDKNMCSNSGDILIKQFKPN